VQIWREFMHAVCFKLLMVRLGHTSTRPKKRKFLSHFPRSVKIYTLLHKFYISCISVREWVCEIVRGMENVLAMWECWKDASKQIRLNRELISIGRQVKSDFVMKCRINFHMRAFLHALVSFVHFLCDPADVFICLTFRQPTHTGPVTWDGPIMSGDSRRTISPGFILRVAT
jgi:hypothetical protein